MEAETAVPANNENPQNPCSANSIILNEAFINMNPQPNTNVENNETLETIGNPLFQQGKRDFIFTLKSLFKC